jgi:hypothetical protein
MKIKGRINPHRPQFTKWRKNKGQFKRKKNLRKVAQ